MQRKSQRKVLTNLALKKNADKSDYLKPGGKLLSPGKIHVFFVYKRSSQNLNTQKNYT